jgi:hypothetical protein
MPACAKAGIKGHTQVMYYLNTTVTYFAHTLAIQCEPIMDPETASVYMMRECVKQKTIYAIPKKENE